jgi:hypothetical protein
MTESRTKAIFKRSGADDLPLIIRLQIDPD